MIRLPLAASLAALAAASPAAAHHGWSGYDTAKALSITAPVLESRYRNPHGELVLEHQGQRWLVTLAPTSRMNARGLSAASLKAGTTVTVEGYASTRQDGEMRAERITVAGKTVELR